MEELLSLLLSLIYEGKNTISSAFLGLGEGGRKSWRPDVVMKCKVRKITRDTISAQCLCCRGDCTECTFFTCLFYIFVISGATGSIGRDQCQWHMALLCVKHPQCTQVHQSWRQRMSGFICSITSSQSLSSLSKHREHREKHQVFKTIKTNKQTNIKTNK